MSNDKKPTLSRRKILGTAGTIGAAGALGGMGTMAFFADEEQFANNQLTAGELDMKVSWEEHYSDWSEDEAEHAHMENGELVIDDQQGFMNATLQEQFPDKRTRKRLEEGTADPCEVLADVPEDLEKPVIDISDVKPGDFGEVTFDFALCDNPGLVWMNGGLVTEAENGTTEPERKDPDEATGVELPDAIQVTLWHDRDCDNLLGQDEEVVFEGSLRNALRLLSDAKGVLLDGEGGNEKLDCYGASPERHCVGFRWELPRDYGNAVQTDSVTFDLGFYTEQCRHNTSGGLLGDQEKLEPIPESEIPEDPEWCTYLVKGARGGDCDHDVHDTLCVLCPEDGECPGTAAYIVVDADDCYGPWKRPSKSCGPCNAILPMGETVKYRFV